MMYRRDQSSPAPETTSISEFLSPTVFEGVVDLEVEFRYEVPKGLVSFFLTSEHAVVDLRRHSFIV